MEMARPLFSKDKLSARTLTKSTMPIFAPSFPPDLDSSGF
jgi:hypothetical protein